MGALQAALPLFFLLVLVNFASSVYRHLRFSELCRPGKRPVLFGEGTIDYKALSNPSVCHAYFHTGVHGGYIIFNISMNNIFPCENHLMISEIYTDYNRDKVDANMSQIMYIEEFDKFVRYHVVFNSSSGDCTSHPRLTSRSETSNATLFLIEVVTTRQNWDFRIDYKADIACKADDHKCTSDLTCIPGKFYCDGAADCDDGSDEVRCPSQLSCVREAHFHCNHDNTCLLKSDVCNGVDDCSDGQDESNCSTTPPNSNASALWLVAFILSAVVVSIILMLVTYKVYKCAQRKKFDRYRHLTVMSDLAKSVDQI